MVDVVVVGAGLAGLTCSHALARAGLDVRCVDGSTRAGGVVETVEVEGHRFEQGPNTVPASARHFRKLCGELGIADELLVSRDAASRRFLYRGGRLHALPTGPVGLLTLGCLSPGGRLRLLSEPLRRFRPPGPDEQEPTLGAFLDERLGREAARVLGGAFVRGVYAAELDQLGAASAFPRLWGPTVLGGGIVRGLFAARGRAAEPLPGPSTRRGQLLSFAEGLGRVPRALVDVLQDRLTLGDAVVELERGAGGWHVGLEGGRSLRAAAVVLATGARDAHRLLSLASPERVDLDPLYRLGHADVTLVHLGLEQPRLPEGFGFLVPPGEDPARAPRLLGALIGSNLFEGRAPAGRASLTCFYRGADVADRDEAGLQELALEDLARALGRAPGIVRACATKRWKGVIPRYGVGHLRRMDELQQSLRRALPGVHLAGTFVGGVSIDDRVATARRVADEVCAARGGAAGGAR